MQAKYDASIRDLELRVEELTKEIAFRAAYLDKERTEVKSVQEEIRAEFTYLND